MEIVHKDYYAQRVREELAKARAASSLEVRHVHETMARLYSIRLEALQKQGMAA